MKLTDEKDFNVYEKDEITVRAYIKSITKRKSFYGNNIIYMFKTRDKEVYSCFESNYKNLGITTDDIRDDIEYDITYVVGSSLSGKKYKTLTSIKPATVGSNSAITSDALFNRELAIAYRETADYKDMIRMAPERADYPDEAIVQIMASKFSSLANDGFIYREYLEKHN